MSAAVEQTVLPVSLPELPADQRLAAFRQAGATHIARVGLPAGTEEEWRFANVDPIAQVKWGLPDRIDVAAMLAEHSLHDRNAIELVFVNGVFAPELSSLDQLPKGLTIGGTPPELGQLVTPHSAAFAAINAAMLRDVAVIRVGRGISIDRPIHVMFLSTSASPAVVAPRLLVVAEPGAVLQVAETFVAHGQILAVPVTEIIALEDSVIDHVRLCTDDGASWHISDTRVTLGRSAQLVTHSLALDGKWTRNDLDIALAGEHAHATLNGAVLLTGLHFCDNHTLIRHEKPECTSHELYKHVVDGKALGVFKGKILVRPGAQKTDAKQTSKTLLVSDTAMMESMPALEIYADDVKCTHGSTIGPLDEDMIFYLRSRGLSLDAARHLLTYAFAADVTRRLRIESIRRRVEDYLARQQDLPLDLRISEAGAHDEAVVD